MQFLFIFRKTWWLRMLKFSKEQIRWQEGFFEENKRSFVMRKKRTICDQK